MSTENKNQSEIIDADKETSEEKKLDILSGEEITNEIENKKISEQLMPAISTPLIASKKVSENLMPVKTKNITEKEAKEIIKEKKKVNKEKTKVEEIKPQKTNEETKTQERTDTEKKQDKINGILNKERKTDNIKDFFEIGTESDFNETFDYIKNNTDPKNKIKFENMVKKYIESKTDKPTITTENTNTTTEVPTPEININLIDADESSIYPKGTRLISFRIGEKTNTIVRGTLGKAQELKADKQKTSLPTEIFGKDENQKELNGLNEFDGRGNYEGFKNFIKSKGSNYVDENLQNIINGIKVYKPKEGSSDALDYKNSNELKNNYANILTDFIILSENKNLQKNYLSQIKPENITILGTDKKIQTENFNKIVKSDLFKDLDEKTRDQIVNTKLSIEGTTKQKFEEGLKTGAKEVIKSFGGLILNIVELFGGKGLIKEFCNKFGIDYDDYFGEIEKLYNEKYGLFPNQKKLLENIYKKNENNNSRKNGNDIMYNWEGKEIKINKKEVSNSYADAFSDENNFKELDPVLVEKYLSTSNINQKDNIIIQEKQSDGKIKTTINPDIKNLTTPEERISIVTDMINEETRKEVQTAGDQISRSNKVYNSELKFGDKIENYKKEQIEKENRKAKEMQEAKGIKDVNDIGMYLGIYLMKGSGDLKYSVSETKELPCEKDKLNIDTEFIEEDGTLKGVENKKIENIFTDIGNSAKELQIIKEGTNNSLVLIKKEIEENGGKLVTYVDDQGNRMEIKNGDKVKLIEKKST